jgi:hypothetical protein
VGTGVGAPVVAGKQALKRGLQRGAKGVAGEAAEKGVKKGAGEALEQGGKGATKQSSKGGVGPVRKGEAGERAVGVTGPKTKILVNGRRRIPDRLTGSTLTEVKNIDSSLTGRCLSYTQQLRDFTDYAKQTGRVFELHVRSTTKLTQQLQDAVKRGDIILKIIPGT